jgi:hypothetical protein
MHHALLFTEIDAVENCVPVITFIIALSKISNMKMNSRNEYKNLW